MKQLTTVDDMKQLGTVLAVWAHPDDESVLAAGVMTAAAKNGQRVVCVTATQGELGIQDVSRWPADALGKIRVAELQAALGVLGVNEHHILSFQDGACTSVGRELYLRALCDIILEVQPDSILTFGPDGWTGHPDHQCVSRWVDEAVAFLGSKSMLYHVVQTPELYEQYLKRADSRFNFFFNIEHPTLVPKEDCDICLELPESLIDVKCTALKAMPSQYESIFLEFGEDFVGHALGTESFIRVESNVQHVN